MWTLRILFWLVSLDLLVYFSDEIPVVKGSARTALEEEVGKESEIGRKAIGRLVDALDSLPMPPRLVDKPFLMPVEDVFSIAGRGTVVTGRIEQGTIKPGEDISIVGRKPIDKINVTAIEMFRKTLDSAQAGDNVGCLLRGIKRDDVTRGEVACKPGTVKTHTKFTAKVCRFSELIARCTV